MRTCFYGFLFLASVCCVIEHIFRYSLLSSCRQQFFKIHESYLIPGFFSLIKLLILSSIGNIEKNPGPCHKNLKFATWNLDSLLTRDGVKKHMIESINSVHSFDLFCICETYLTNNVADKDLEVEGFSQVPFRADSKAMDRPQGGVCVYYKENLPIKNRTDLSLLDETIVVEVALKNKNYSLSSLIDHQVKILLMS